MAKKKSAKKGTKRAAASQTDRSQVVGLDVGRKSKEILTHYINALFKQQPRKKLTDEELHDIIQNEFPKRQIQSVAAYRSYYNNEKHGFGGGQRIDRYKEGGEIGTRKKPTKKGGAGKKKAAKKRGATVKKGGKKKVVKKKTRR